MYIKLLSINNFRNYSNENIELNPNINIFIGLNAQGKTNLLEAIEFTATGKSHRTSSDKDLIKFSSSTFHLSVTYDKNAVSNSIECNLTENNGKTSKQFKLNEQIIKSRKELIGNLLTVSFKTFDLNLTQNSPQFRRDWLDNIASVISKIYLEIHNNYLKLIKHKNALLKNEVYQHKSHLFESIDVYNQQIANLGAKIIKYRIKTLLSIQEYASLKLQKISSNNDNLQLKYLSQVKFDDDLENLAQEDIANTIYKTLKSIIQLEIQRKQCLIGPHKDDVSFLVNNLIAKGFASQGQHRSIVLALKLAELNLIQEKFSDTPILLLDDVLAELDLLRQEQLFKNIDENCQTIISTTSIENLPQILFSNSFVFRVNDGKIQKS